VASVGSFVVIATVVANVMWMRYRSKKNKQRVLTPPDYQEVEFGDMKKAPNVSRSKILLLLSMQDVKNIFLVFFSKFSVVVETRFCKYCFKCEQNG
jgi:hypothetical protein